MKIPVLIPNIFNHPFTYDDNGLNLKKGDSVLYGKYSGTEINIDGTDYLIMKESDIFGIV